MTSSVSPDLLARLQRVVGPLSPREILVRLAREAAEIARVPSALATYAPAAQGWPQALHVVSTDEDASAQIPAAARSAAFGIFRRLAAAHGPLTFRRSDPESSAMFAGLGQVLELKEDFAAIPILSRGSRVSGMVAVPLTTDVPASTLSDLEALASFAATALQNAVRHLAARRDQDRLLLFAEAIQEALWDLNTETGEVWWSGGIRALIGSGPDAQVVPTFEWKLSRIHPDDVLRVRTSLQEAVSNPESSWREQYRLRRGDGTYIEVEDRAYFLRHVDHRAFRVVGAIRDVSELVRAVRARDDFLSVAAHELRTPLTPLQLQLQDLAKRTPELARDAEASKWLENRAASLRRHVGRMAKLVDGLLDLSRIMGGRLRLEPEPIDFVTVVREVAVSFAEESARSGSELRLTGETSITGTWDRLRVEQVVTNLISNALKYGEGKPVQVRVRRDGERVILDVADQGLGIAPEHQDRIFGRFERAVSVRHYGGLGLGLFIVRQIVEAMGGEISVESELGRGATFTVALPLDTPAPRA